MLKWLLRIGLILVALLALLWLWKGDELKRLLAVNSLFTPEKIVANFSHMDTLFLTQPLRRTSHTVVPLPEGPRAEMPDGFDDFVASRSLTAIVVLKNGELVYEDYYQGTTADDRRISWSVAKSWLSALLGILIDEGAIGSIDEPVTQYAPALSESAYEGATIRDVLQMSSGVVFNEDYFDFHSDINRMGRELALGGSMDGFAAALTDTFIKPGTQWQYVSIDTHVIGMVIRGATGRPISELMIEKLVEPLGLESEPYYLTDGDGVAFVLGGLNMRTRDYARFGQMIANGGRWADQQVVPATWVRESTSASAATAPGEKRYGYQWWLPPEAGDGQFFAHGVYNQYVYIDPSRNVVIALNAANRRFREAGVSAANLAMLHRIASGL